MMAVFLVLAVITGILAGSYPAFYLSSFRPVQVLKGKMSGSLAAVSLRRALVVLQFVISVVLIVASIVITAQMRYMQQKDLGFTKEQQLVVPLRSDHAKNIAAALKNDLAAVPQIRKVGATMYYPGIFNPSDNLYYRDGQSMKDGIRTRINRVDFDFLPALGVHIVAGRLFSPDFPSDTASCVVVNESLVHDIGFSSAASAVNQQIHFDWQGISYHFRVIGVVRDFHHESLHLPIAPFAFAVMNNDPGTPFNYLLVHTETADMRRLLGEVENRWHRLNPDEPFEYSFIDTDFMKNYEAERRLSSLVGYFTLIAIIISCLGLFGLSAFSAEQRTREIGIRKVLGASVTGVTALLSRDFLKLVGIAMVIALPAAWWIMHRWLLDFAYRTRIGWEVFAITVLSVIMITFLTISFQAVKAALANPAKSLRTE
jgi:putative ABC transport system permease protein